MSAKNIKAKNIKSLLFVLFCAAVFVIIIVTVARFAFSSTASNSVKTSDINKTIDLIHLQEFGTIKSDSGVYSDNTTLGHQLTRDIKLIFDKPKSANDIKQLFESHGVKQVEGNQIWTKSYNGVKVFMSAEPVEVTVTSSGLDPNEAYSIYTFKFNTI